MLSLETSIGLVADLIPNNSSDLEKNDLDILGDLIQKIIKNRSSLWSCNNLDKALKCFVLAAQFTDNLKKENLTSEDKQFLKKIFSLGYLCASKNIKVDTSKTGTLIHRIYLISSCRHILNELLDNSHPYDIDLEELEEDQSKAEIIGPSPYAVDSLIFSDLYPIKGQLEIHTPPQSQILRISFNIARGKYGEGIYTDQMLRIGKLNHDRLYNYLNWKVIQENNLNFSDMPDYDF